jgi:hypothetical protein
MCCGKGTVELLPFPDPPEPLSRHLCRYLYSIPCLLVYCFTGADTTFDVDDRRFRENLRNYNTFAFTSLGVSVDRSVYGPWRVYTFRIKGELCHQIVSLLPPPEGTPAFAQLSTTTPIVRLMRACHTIVPRTVDICSTEIESWHYNKWPASIILMSIHIRQQWRDWQPETMFEHCESKWPTLPI